MPKDENIKNGQIIAKYLFMILFIGLIPFIGIFFVLTFNPYIQPFIIIADFTRDWRHCCKVIDELAFRGF